ncbi:MAG: esterase-like activity of phytase family protein [Chitinophagaceae bacterium]|nr:esterase-like activity of phytase family protein [Chitinophagaceae bacterium]
MSKPHYFLLPCLLALHWPVAGQAPLSFELVTYKVLDAAHHIPAFGGISSIERSADGFVLLSDHYRDGRSYLFMLDDSLGIEPATQAPDLADVESFRSNTHTGIHAYTFEGKKHTGLFTIKYLLHKNPVYDTLVLETLPGRQTTDNRGIEALAFAADSSLWMAFESGGDTNCSSSSLPFRRYNYDRIAQQYSADDFTAYTYPFDPCTCTATKNGARFNGWVGNGVSEILFLPGSSDRLLVLERCFDGQTGHVVLWLATIHPGSNTLSKEAVFDFNHSLFEGFIPDNLEGMCWGKEEQGHPVLYLVSDDNYRPGRQQTQLLQLRMKVFRTHKTNVRRNPY